MAVLTLLTETDSEIFPVREGEDKQSGRTAELPAVQPEIAYRTSKVLFLPDQGFY
jgi:hypothetical protein